jgi:hypothetical protein
MTSSSRRIAALLLAGIASASACAEIAGLDDFADRVAGSGGAPASVGGGASATTGDGGSAVSGPGGAGGAGGGVTELPPPLAYYRFDANAVDAAGSYDGIVEGAPRVGQGMVDQALSFDGLDDAVLFDDWPALAQVSISLWVRLESGMMPAEPRPVLDRWHYMMTDERAIFIVINDIGHFEGQVSPLGLGAGNPLVDLGMPEFREWVHYALVYDGTDLLLYANAEAHPAPAGATQGAILHADLVPVSLARDRYGDNHLAVTLDELAVWDVALPASSVAALHAAGRAGQSAATLWRP